MLDLLTTGHPHVQVWTENLQEGMIYQAVIGCHRLQDDFKVSAGRDVLSQVQAARAWLVSDVVLCAAQWRHRPVKVDDVSCGG